MINGKKNQYNSWDRWVRSRGHLCNDSSPMIHLNARHDLIDSSANSWLSFWANPAVSAPSSVFLLRKCWSLSVSLSSCMCPGKILLPVSRKSFSFWSFFKILRQCPGFFSPLEISDFIKESQKYLQIIFVCPSFCLILAMNNEHPEGDLLTGVVREGRSSSR